MHMHTPVLIPKVQGLKFESTERVFTFTWQLQAESKHRFRYKSVLGRILAEECICIEGKYPSFSRVAAVNNKQQIINNFSSF